MLCTNTMHKVAGAIEDAVSVPLLHLGDATAEAVRAAGLAKVGLLGTGFTMSQDFYRARLESHGLDRAGALARRPGGRCTRSSTTSCARASCARSRGAAYVDVAGRLVDDGAEGIILGCTEIELLLGPDDLDVPSFPTTTIHVAAAVEAALD